MNDRDIRRYERATRVQTFGVENDSDLAAGGKAKTHFSTLDGLIAQVDGARQMILGPFAFFTHVDEQELFAAIELGFDVVDGAFADP